MKIKMKILVACEYSGIVRDAFIAKGHNAISCDLLPTESPGPHYQGSVFDILYSESWDMLIAFPPCTYLTCTANRAMKDDEKIPGRPRLQNRILALDFVNKLMNCGIKKIAIENPVGVISTQLKKPTQIIQPYMFGHTDSKKTCLWLNGLPALTSTNIVEPEWIICRGKKYSKTHYSNPNNGHLRSKTYQGIANAMANQWG